MKHPSNELMNSTAPLFIIIGNDKGGQGKSLLGLAIADHAHLSGAHLGVAQIDEQLRLGKALGRKVLTIDAIPEQSRRDPGAETRIFTPLHAFLQRAARSGASVMVDVGANQMLRLAFWAGLLDLQEDLDNWGFQTVLMVPYMAEAEAIRQAGRTVSLIRSRLPGTRLVLVENERDGQFSELSPESDAVGAYGSIIEPLKHWATVLSMPAVPAGAWRRFEASNCRLITVSNMASSKVMALTGLPLPEAKIARGDVAGWALAFFEELDRVLPWSLPGGDDNG